MTASSHLGKVREIQRRLEDFYGLEAGPDVTSFVRAAPNGERETLFLREQPGTVEIALLLPEDGDAATLDGAAQLVEGVSHFVYVAERARIELPTTELELELQAEVDKFVLLAFDGPTLKESRASTACDALYGNVRHLHPEGSERGSRYRLAARLAERLVGRLTSYEPSRNARRFLQRFYRGGQADKIRLATAC